MGFVDGLGRLLSGKPVFQVGDSSSPTQTPASDDASKMIPRVSIIRAETIVNGPDMQVSIQIKNESSEEIYVDKIRVFNQMVELNEFLRPNEVYEHTIYNGPKFTNQNASPCDLQYRKQDGDFFSMSHVVSYGFRDDAYVVDAVKPVGAVRDI